MKRAFEHFDREWRDRMLAADLGDDREARCGQCRDTGLVTCYNPWIVTAITKDLEKVTACGVTYRRNNPDGSLHWSQPTAIPCKCELGNAHLVRYGRDGKPIRWNDHRDGGHEEQHRYGEKWWHVRILDPKAEHTDADHAKHLLKVVADDRDHLKTRRRITAFDEWNAEDDA